MDNSQAAKILGVDASNIKSATRYGNGTYYTCNGYYVYIPDDVTSSTSAFIYYPGSGGAFPNDASRVKQHIESGQANEIVIISNDAYSPRDSGGSAFIQMVHNIASANNTEINRIDNMCFSASGPSGFNTIVNTASQDPETHHTAVFADVVGFSPSEAQIQTLKNSDTTLLFVEPRGTVEHFEKTLAQNGVDVYLAWAADGSHIACNRDILQGGLIDFLSGETDSLSNVGSYKFVKYDANSGKWVEVSFDEVQEKFSVESNTDPFRYYEKLSKISDLECNNSFIKDHMNEIRGMIRNSDFLSSTSFEGYSSTTQVPNDEGEIALSFFSECSILLNKLEKATASIVQIGNSIQDLNDTSQQEAQALNNSVNYYSSSPTYSTTPTSSYPSNPTSTTPATPTEIPTTDTPTETEEQKKRKEKIAEIKKKFIVSDELYTDDEKYVYESKDGHRVVIHYDDEGVLSLEYYYYYENEEEAKKNIDVLKDKFANVEDVVQEGNTLKVIFKDSLYKDAKVEDVKKRYKEMDEVVKPETTEEPTQAIEDPTTEIQTSEPVSSDTSSKETKVDIPDDIAALEREFAGLEPNVVAEERFIPDGVSDVDGITALEREFAQSSQESE